MKSSQQQEIRRISKEFAKLLDEIKKERLSLGIDTMHSIKADWRITLAMFRHPKMMEIKEDIISSELK